MISKTDDILFKDHKISIIIAWTLRLFLIIFGIYEIIFGFPVYGFMILVAVSFILLPAILTRQHIFIPLELEILFLIIIVLEYVVADSLSFYARFGYYDKFQHTMIPAIISFMGVLLVYIGYRFGKFKASYLMSGIIIVFVTIGMGAVLEVIEYSYDHFIGPATNFYITQGALTQGSSILDPFTDTMTDLMVDIVGAVIGAVFGVWILIRHEKNNKKSLLDDEIEIMKDYGKNNNKIEK
ncbi:hypothetical protein [Methanobacterium spitsbergense]|uniref:DUF2238 domain-containing protein n=1 Tax=Methanobacterium spitsbergense TaxID=2874285 RepID=A0A8T5UYM9_9EURY|nr:hypothetical protein [Methanobacterium spitsbergense]MBZ2164525.1 hypothetical protein [Methanobacterium spitsbergense]